MSQVHLTSSWWTNTLHFYAGVYACRIFPGVKLYFHLVQVWISKAWRKLWEIFWTTDGGGHDSCKNKSKQTPLPYLMYIKSLFRFEEVTFLCAFQDSHSIVFLCDLHIHFPLSILESIRKHCVESRLAFAPIVMRLDCGSSPLEPHGIYSLECKITEIYRILREKEMTCGLFRWPINTEWWKKLMVLRI